MNVTINANHLSAAAACSETNDVRYYLNGVFVEARPTETRLVATEGNILAVLRDLILTGRQDDMPNVIIPLTTIKLALQTKSAALSLSFVDLKWSLAGISFMPVDGRFPEYRRIIPYTTNGEAAQFHLAFLAAFGKIGKALGSRLPPVIRHNGKGGAQVSFVGFEEEFVGVVMPFDHFKKDADKGLIRWGGEHYRAAPEEDFSDLA